MRRGAGVGLLVLSIVAAGCGAGEVARSASVSAVASASVSAVASASPVVSMAASAGGGSAAASSAAPQSGTGSSTAGPVSPASSAAVDPTLLALLPAAVDGRAIVETPDAEYGSAADPAIARSAARLAMGYVSSVSGADWAIMSIVALRPGVWSEGFYRDWRDTYDASLCEPQGGVAGHAVATIAGRQVDIASCGPLRTYHVHLAGPDVVVSVATVGEARFGEQVLAGLRP